MLWRFCKLKSCIQKFVVDLPELNPNLSEEEWDLLNTLVKVLKPLKMDVEALCCSESTILSAERVFGLHSAVIG